MNFLRHSYILMVPSARLELAQPKPLPPQDSVSTNSTTTASLKQDIILALLKLRGKINSIKNYFGTVDPTGASGAFGTSLDPADEP